MVIFQEKRFAANENLGNNHSNDIIISFFIIFDIEYFIT